MKPKNTAKHAASRRLRTRIARTTLRAAGITGGVAVVATGVAVSGGVLAGSAPMDSAAAALTSTHHSSALTQAELDARQEQTSRSADRTVVPDRRKVVALSAASGRAVTRTVDLSHADPRSLARALMPQYGLSVAEFGCLNSLWNSESGWNIHADNPGSSAYGIPQALPGSKMASAGPNWQSNPETQIRWGLQYVRRSYGSACGAWSFKQGHGWY